VVVSLKLLSYNENQITQRYNNMNIGQVIAQNITDLLSISGEQLKAVHARAAERGIHLNYPMLAKLGSTRSEAPKNPSLETLDKVVEVLRTIPGQEGLQHWMLLCEGFFKGQKSEFANLVTEDYMREFVDEFLFALTTMKVLELENSQFEQMKNVAKFCYMKKLNITSTKNEDLKQAGNN
jgi:hypothetical protein